MELKKTVNDLANKIIEIFIKNDISITKQLDI